MIVRGEGKINHQFWKEVQSLYSRRGNRFVESRSEKKMQLLPPWLCWFFNIGKQIREPSPPPILQKRTSPVKFDLQKYLE